MAQTGGFDFDIPRLFEIAQGFENAFAGFTDFFGGGIRFDGEEARAAFSRVEEAFQEFLPLRRVSSDDAVLGMAEGQLESGIKKPCRFEDFVFFEVGDDCLQDERADVRGAGNIVAADVEFIALAEEVVQEFTPTSYMK